MLRLFTADDQYMGFWSVVFNIPIQFNILGCSQVFAEPPVGDEVEKTWTFRKTAIALIIECNGVEVLNYKFSESTCASKYEGMIKKIMFSTYDTASDSYQQKILIGNERGNQLSQTVLFPLSEEIEASLSKTIPVCIFVCLINLLFQHGAQLFAKHSSDSI